MIEIHVNLKRFDVPRRFGGICPMEDPIEWIEAIISRTVELKLGLIDDLHLNYLLPEALLKVVKLLLYFHEKYRFPITILLMGQNELRSTIRKK